MSARFALLVLVLVAVVTGCGKAPATEAAPPVVWHTLEEGEALARRDHKPALVFFYAEWSTADKELDYETFPNPDVRAAMKDYVAIKVDCTDDEVHDVNVAKERFKVIGLPTIIVLDSFEPRTTELVRFNEFIKPKKLADTLGEANRYMRTRKTDLARHQRKAKGLLMPPAIDWKTDFNEPIEKPVLAFVFDPSDDHCKQVMMATFDDPVIRSLVDESFVAVKIPSIPGNPALIRLQTHYGYGYPPITCELVVAPKVQQSPNYRTYGPMLPTPLADWLEYAKEHS